MNSPRTRQKRVFFDKRYVHQERRRAHNWALIYFGSIVMTLFLQQNVISLGVVSDKSMLPTLHDGEYYLINRYLYYFTRPKRGDIVVLHPNFQTIDQYVKRVVAVGGDEVSAHDGHLYVNGRPAPDMHALGATDDFGPFTVPGYACFVMGDNRQNSEDSRVFGPVPLRNIKGKISTEALFPLR